MDEQFESLKLEIPLPDAVYDLSDLFSGEGAGLYAVGGAVREHVFRHFHSPNDPPPVPKDVDLATELPPKQVMKVLSSHRAKSLGVKVFPKGAAFGVISAVLEGEEFEIATFREEWYDPEKGDGRRPDKVKFSSPGKDAARRDLTINALFYHLQEKEVRDYNLDLYGRGQGLDDIRNKRVRTVGHPSERFREDKLRVLRFVRFFSQYNYGNILQGMDVDTVLAFAEHRDMEGVSPERVANEFLAGLKRAFHAPSYLRNLDVLALMPRVFGGLLPDMGSQVEKLAHYSRNPKVILAYLFRGSNPKVVRDKLNSLKYPNEIADGVSFLLQLKRMQPKDVAAMLRKRDLYKQLTDEQEKAMAWDDLRRDVTEFALLTEKPHLHHFLTYERVAKAENYLHLKGPEIGKAMAQAEEAGYVEWLRKNNAAL